MPPPPRTEQKKHSVAVIGPGWVQVGADRRKVDVRSAWQAIRIAESVPLDHPNSAIQMWILAEQVSALGLEVYPEDTDASPQSQRTSVERQLAVAGEPFLAEAIGKGWRIDSRGLGPRTTLINDSRWVQLVLEPYQWIHDSRSDAVAGDDETTTALAADPITRAAQIIKRVEVADSLFGVLPMSTPALTGQKILDVHYQRKEKAKRAGRTSINAAGRNLQRIITEPGVLPEMDGRAGLKGEVVPATTWWRQPTKSEVEAATFAIMLDQRMSYVAQCSSLVLGIGEPKWIDANEAIELAERVRDGDNEAKNTFAVWRCEPTVHTVWGDPQMFPPHPDLRNDSAPTWAPPPTMKILVASEDDFGCAASLKDIGVTGAYLWPDAGRMLEPLYKAVQKAHAQVRAMEADPALDDPALRAWLTRFGKSVGRATIGRLASEWGRNDAYPDEETKRRGKPWRYQPIMWETSKAACTGKLWWQASMLKRKFGIRPVQAATDSLTYLVDDDTAAALEAADDGRLGILKVDKVALLMPGVADGARAELLQLGGRRPNQIIPWHEEDLLRDAADEAEFDEAH